jgi:TolA-binding protein
MIKKSLFLTLAISLSFSANAKKGDVIGELRTKSVDGQNAQNKVVASEVLISQTEKKALGHLKTLIKKYRGTSMEPNLKFRLAELYMNRAKSARFIEQMVIDNDGVSSFLPSQIKSLKEKKMVEKAILEYSGIEARFPKYNSIDEVLFNKAFAQLQIGNEGEAEKSFITLLRTQKRSKLRPDAFLAVGEINFKRRNFKRALAFFTQVKKYKESRVYPYGLYKGAWCYYNLSGYKQAMDQLEQVIYFGAQVQRDGGDQRLDLRVEALTDMALFYSSVRPAKEAVTYFTKLSGDKDPLPGLRKLGRIYEKHGKDVKQGIVLTDLIEAFPNSDKIPFFHRDLARNQNRQARYKNSVSHLWSFYKTCKAETAKVTEKEIEEPCIDDVISLSKRLAIKWLKEFKENKNRDIMAAASENAFRVHLVDQKVNDENSQMRFLFAEHLFALKKYGESSEEYTKVADSTKDKERHHQSRYAAIVSFDLSHGSKIKGDAVAIFRALSKSYMDDFPKGDKYLDVGFKLGLFDYTNKNYDLASPMLIKLGDQFAQNEKGKKSQDLYLDILNSKKSYLEIQKFAKKWKEGEKTVSRQANLQNIFEQAFFSEVELLEGAKSYKDAISRYVDFVKENPDSKLLHEARWNKIALHFKLKEYDKTAEDYIAFNELHPKNPKAISGLVKAVEIYEMMAEPEQAYKVTEILRASDPKNTQRWNYLSANYLKASGRYEEAAKKFFGIVMAKDSTVEFRKYSKADFFDMKDQLMSTSVWYQAKIKDLMKWTGARKIASTATRIYGEHLYSSGDSKVLSKFVAENKWNTKLNKEQIAILHKYDGEKKERQYFGLKIDTKSMDTIVQGIQAKTKKMDQVQNAYQRALADDEPKVAISSLLGLSRTYQRFVDELKNLESPKTFSKEETVALKAELSNITMQFEEKAAEALDQALKVATDGKVKDGSLKKIRILFDKVNLDEKTVFPITLNLPKPIGPRGY